MNTAKNTSNDLPFFEHPWVGTTLTSLAAIMFYFICMLLPLVGPSGAKTVHYTANFYTFLSVLLLALLFAAGGFFSKSKRRKHDASPYPYVAAGLTALYVILFFCLILGLFKI